jgi:hypothetical protein
LEAKPSHGGKVEEEHFGVAFGTNITVHAIEYEFFHFTHWSEDGKQVCSDKDYNFDVTKSRHLVAHFSSETFDITLLANPPDGGTFEGGGTGIPFLSEHTIKAIANDCYDFVEWIDDDSLVIKQIEYTFIVDRDRTFRAYFVSKPNVSVTTSADPAEGGMAVGEYKDIPCGDTITIKAFAYQEYNFEYWSIDGEEVSSDAEYTFAATRSGDYVAHFVANNYTITLIADPEEMGTVSGGGAHPYGKDITVLAHPFPGFSLDYWSEDGEEVSTDADYTFTVTRSRTLTAHFEKTRYTVKVFSNDTVYGNVSGGGKYDLNETVTVKAFVKSGYQFSNWTIDSAGGDFVSASAIYEFPVVENITLVANFYGLEFDTYAATLWDNTFLLDLKLLASEGYEVTGCNWFKNGIKEVETNTIDEFSYSAGPNSTDLLELEPTWYMFQLVTKNGSLLNSTKKMLTDWQFHYVPIKSSLYVYPNPVYSGAPFKLEGVTSGTPIEVYNQYGVCVSRTIARDEIPTMSLNLPVGVYIIRNDNKATRITIIK